MAGVIEQSIRFLGSKLFKHNLKRDSFRLRHPVQVCLPLTLKQWINLSNYTIVGNVRVYAQSNQTGD